MDEFLEWILEGYREGVLSEEDIDLALTDDYFAYGLFIDCWSCDKPGTTAMAKEVFAKAKRMLARRNKRGNAQT